MPSVERKFRLAGKGGMSIIYTEPIASFHSRCGARREVIAPVLLGYARRGIGDLDFPQQPLDLRAGQPALGIGQHTASHFQVLQVEGRNGCYV